MSTFTSSLPNNLLKRLDDTAKKMNLPKNKLIERALEIYLDQLNRAEYVKSYRRAAADADVVLIAEEGMIAYFKDLDKDVAG